MKVLLVESNLKGHHLPYLKALAELDLDICFILPDICTEFPIIKQRTFNLNLKKYSDYIVWIKFIERCAYEWDVDVIHFLYGDIFYRFFGNKLRSLRSYKILVTFHHIRKGLLHNISLKRIFHRIYKGVVHTEVLEEYIYSKRLKNVCKVEYPVFERIQHIDKSIAKKQLSITDDELTILYFGGTRYDKGLDILLDALKYVNIHYKLVIAGNAEYFTEEFIKNHFSYDKHRIILLLRFINEQEIPIIFSAADCVVLPYRKIFDGASGPLAIGCMYNKKIVGPNHGSLKRIIENNHLGVVFETENTYDLSKKIEEQINSFIYDDIAINYKKSLNPLNFQKAYMYIYKEIE